MVKIIHLITDLDTGGAEVMLYKLLARTDRRFCSLVVSMTDAGKLAGRFESLGIPVLTLGMRRTVPSPSGFLRFIRILKRENPHVLQTWMYHSDLLGLMAGKLAGVPNITWNVRCSNMDMRQYPILSALVVRMLAKLSGLPNVVLVNSEAGRKFHEMIGYRPRRWLLMPNGFDLEQLHPSRDARVKLRKELGLSEETVLIGMVARYDPMKDHQNFLEAAQRVLKEEAEVHFVLVGLNVDKQNQELAHAITQLGLEGRVHLLGLRSDAPMVAAGLDIATSTSAYGEGFPNVVGEAMACGVPCVVTDVGDSAAIVGGTGEVVPPRDPSALRTAWGRLIGMGGEGRQRLGLAARERIRHQFDIVDIVKKYERCYDELVAGPR